VIDQVSIDPEPLRKLSNTHTGLLSNCSHWPIDPLLDFTYLRPDFLPL